MKKSISTVLSLSICLFMGSVTVSASEMPSENEVIVSNEKEVEKIEKNIDLAFEKLGNEDEVLRLPDGGYISGKIEFYHNDIFLAEYDGTKDIRAISVESAKKELVKESILAVNNGKSINNEMSSRSADLPQLTAVLGYNASYISGPFSAKGIRFSGYQFEAAENTGGPYLRWSTYYDSGRVGTRWDALFALTGSMTSGVEISQNYYYWIPSVGGTIYWTYNPIKGSFYMVANVSP